MVTYHKFTWILLIVFGVFFVLAPIADLKSVATTGLPSDHVPAFSHLSGLSWQSVKSTGIAKYVTQLEFGYALHELVFGILFILVAVIPFRKNERWAWWALWVGFFASLGYSLTFGTQDKRILAYSLVTTIGIPLVLLASAPRFFIKVKRPN